ncbi:MAG: hypothetical protein ACKV2T_27570 [Kofleriaceae bacterium]
MKPTSYSFVSLVASALVASPVFAQDTPTDAPTEPGAAPSEPAATPAPVPPPEPTSTTPKADVIVEPADAKIPFVPWSTTRLAIDLELVTQGRYTSKTSGNQSELRLDRGELGARVGLGDHAAAELRLEAIRSASDGGALGIDGDSTVVRVKYANVGGSVDLGPLILDSALGFVGDPWIRTIEAGYTLKPLSRTGSERLLGWPTSDLAALVRGTVGPARISVNVGNGEGQRYPERNTGKTTTAVVEVVVANTDAIRASLSGMFRDGSVGVARVRDRRAGGGANVQTPWARGGVEVVRAWGIGDRGDAEGLEIGAWADARVVDKLHLGARVATLGYVGGGRASTFGGAIAIEPWRSNSDASADERPPRTKSRVRRHDARVRLWLALDRVTTSGAAMPLPGADGGDATIVLLVASASAPFLVD